MKYFTVLFLLTACQSNELETSNNVTVLYGAELKSLQAVESALIARTDGNYDLYYDKQYKGSLDHVVVSPSGNYLSEQVELASSGYRFFYASEIEVLKTEQLITVPKVPECYNVWNVAEVKIENTVHTLAECSPDAPGQTQVRLAYFVNGELKGRIAGGGNAWAGSINGQLVTVYGLLVNGVWEIRAAKFIDGVFVETGLFISQPHVHIADPHLVKTAEGYLMTFSIDQSHLGLAKVGNL